jgi:hypothetical protein
LYIDKILANYLTLKLEKLLLNNKINLEKNFVLELEPVFLFLPGVSGRPPRTGCSQGDVQDARRGGGTHPGLPKGGGIQGCHGPG